MKQIYPTYFDSIMSVTKSNGDYWELDKNGEMKRIKPNQLEDAR